MFVLVVTTGRLESVGLNAFEELLFKMLGMGREDSNACLSAKEIEYFKAHFLKA